MAQVIPTMALKIDTSGAVKNIKKLNDEFKVTSGNLNTVNKSVNGTADAIDNTTKSTESLKAQLRAMTQELQGLEPGTAEFNSLATAAGKLKDQITDTNAVINATAGSGLENFAGAMTNVAGVGISAFQGIAGAQAMFGSDSEQLMKLMAKLQGAMALGQALKDFGALGDTFTNIKAQLGALTAGSQLFNKATVAQAVATGTATTAQKIMNAVMKANPIFLIIGAITALVGAFAYFSSSGEDVAKTQDDINTQFEDGTKRANALSEAVGNIAEEYDKYAALIQDSAVLKAEDALNDVLRDRPKAYSEIIQKIKELTTAQLEALKLEDVARNEGLDREEQFRKDKIGLLEREREELNKLSLVGDDEAQLERHNRIKAIEESLFDLKAAQTIETIVRINANQEYFNAKEKLEIDSENKIAEINKKASEERLDLLKQLNQQEKDLLFELNTDKAKEINKTYDDEVAKAEETFSRIKQLTAVDSKDRLSAQADYDSALKLASLKRERDLALLILNERKNNTLNLETQINNLRTKLVTAQGIEAVAYAIQLHEKEKELLLNQMEFELSNTTLTEEEKLKIKSDYALKVAEMDKAFRDKSLDDSTETVDKQTMKFKEMFKKVGETWAEDWAVIMERIVDFTVNVGMQITDLLGQAFSQLNDQATYAVQENARVRTEELDDELANRLISEEQYRRKIDSLEDQKLQKERAIKKKQFNQDKALRITNAIMLGAQAVMAALATLPPASYVMAGINAGLAAAQIGIISSQQFTAARGGIVPGMASKVDSVDAKLAPGEMVINSNSSSMFPTLLSEINKAGGGISLAPDPIVSMMGGRSNNIFTQNETVLTAVVVESQMSSTQKRVRRMEDSASFG